MRQKPEGKWSPMVAEQCITTDLPWIYLEWNRGEPFYDD